MSFDNTAHTAGSAAENATGTAWTPPWPELQELVSRFEAHPYPVDALPDSIRDAVIEVQAFMQAPMPMVANSAVSALSLAIQGFADVERASKLAGPCSLYTLTIADSGERKTTVDGFFMKPIREYEAEVRETKKADLLRYESDMEVFEAKKSGYKDAIKAQTKSGELTAFTENALRDLEAKERPKKPIIPRWIYSDATPEALANELVTNWPVGALVSSEAGSVLGGAGMSKDSAMRNMARLNELWEGRVPATERVQGISYSGAEVRFSVSLQVQEETIRAFFENTKGLARGTGFLARFFLAWPASTMGTRFWEEPPGGWPCLNAFTSRVKDILKEPIPVNSDTGEISPLMHRFSDDGKAAWIEFYNAVEKELGIGGEMTDVKDVASKTADNAARLACIFHVFQGKQGGIDSVCVGAASRIALWHLYEARRFFGEIAMPEKQANAARMEKWLIAYCKQNGTDKVSTRDFSRSGPGSLRDQGTRDETFGSLVSLGRARGAKDGKKTFFQVRPEVLEGAS